METTRYRIVFRGEVGLGYDQDEIRQNLAQLTHWDVRKIDQLLDSSHCIIKSDLDIVAAEQMLNVLNNTGIICQKERIPESDLATNGSTVSATIAVQGRPTVGTVEVAANPCPKCGHPQNGGLCCPACGVIFAKFGQSRATTVSAPAVARKVDSSYSVALQRSAKRRRDDPLSKFEQSHPLGYYLGKLLLVIVGAILLRSLYKADLTYLILLLLPVGFILYLGALSSIAERPLRELMTDHLTLLPILSSDREGRTAFPFATYGLVLLHVLLYFALQLVTPVEILQENWFFLPVVVNVQNLFFSAFASLFFHPSGFAFLSSLLFLWIIGATLERRIGSGLMVGIYLVCGLLAAGVGVGVQRLFPGAPLQIIGAGGALAGLLGVFAIRCHLRTMTFPLPFFGLDILVVGAPYQVRWSSLFIAGLFVLADLNVPAEAGSAGRGSLGLIILLGGMLSGLLAAYILGFDNEVGDEEDESVSGSTVFTVDEGTLRRRLEANPDCPDLALQLARVIAGEQLTDEARQLYRKAIVGRLSGKPKEAMEIYREFILRYQEVFEPKLTLRLAALYLRHGDLALGASVLHPVCDDMRATPQEREKALYQYVATIARLGQIEEAYMMLNRFSNDFPESPLLPKLREMIYETAQAQQG